jgi:hypothetical protein
MDHACSVSNPAAPSVTDMLETGWRDRQHTPSQDAQLGDTHVGGEELREEECGVLRCDKLHACARVLWRFDRFGGLQVEREGFTGATTKQNASRRQQDRVANKISLCLNAHAKTLSACPKILGIVSFKTT